MNVPTRQALAVSLISLVAGFVALAAEPGCTKQQGATLVASVPDAAALGVCIATAALSGQSVSQIIVTCTPEAVKVGLDLTPLFVGQSLASVGGPGAEKIRATPAYGELTTSW